MVAAEQAHKHIPDFRPGDTVRVHIRVVEGDSERIQAFEGVCLLRRGRGDGASFTVRKVSFGVGVERTFPLFSPHIDKVEVIKSGKVRRARLYYLRQLTGRAARLAEEERPGTAAVQPAAEIAPAPPVGGADKSRHAEAEKGAAAPAAAQHDGKPGPAADAASAKANVAAAVKAGSTAK